MTRKLALLGLTLVAVALALWFVLAYGTDATKVVEHPSDPVAAQPSSSVAAEDGKSTRASELPAAPRVATRLRVRSSAGIPLAFVEIDHAGSWERLALVEGGCEAGALALPATVRAPGHCARTVESVQAEVVLEPDALLMIEGDPLRSCLDEVGIEEEPCRRLEDWGEARARAIASGWVSDSKFGIAVAFDRLEPLPPRLMIEVVRADRLRTYIEFVVRPGLRARWEMPCTGESAGLPLDVRVERLPGTANQVRLVLLCSAPPGSSRAEDVPWGTVASSTMDLNERIVLRAREELAHFPRALVGRAHVLAALDELTHAYGRIDFVHDGRQRTLVLREALEIRGRVVEAQSRRPLRRVDLYLEGLGSPGWLIDENELELDVQGNFSLRAPQRAPEPESMQLDPPQSWSLSVEHPGFDALTLLRFERGSALLLDVGEIALVRHKNPIVLAPGHGLSSKELDGHVAVFADKPEEVWPTLRGVVLDDGRFEIECRTSKDNGAAPVMMRANLLTGVEEFVPFERSLGTILFVHVVDDVRSFRLESDSLYHRVPEDVLELTLRTEALPGDGSSWKLGWSWDGAWIRVGQLASEVMGNETKARITIPHGAQQLWWSSTGLPPDLHGDPGGFQAISGSSMKVVLH